MPGRVVVTGASRGIGRALALALAARKHPLVVTARTRGDLESLALEVAEKHQVDCQVVACDLGEVAGREYLAARCKELGGVAGLVNNAGFGTAGLFATVDAAKDRALVRLNVEAVVDLCHLFLPLLQGQPGAFIINVASTAAFQPVPTFASYAASKAFVLSFSEALADELAPAVHVMALCPGITETGFQKEADVVVPSGEQAATAEEVAAYALASLDARKRVAIHGLRNALLATGSRLGPRGLVVKVSRKVMEPWFKGRS